MVELFYVIPVAFPSDEFFAVETGISFQGLISWFRQKLYCHETPPSHAVINIGLYLH